MAIIRVVKYDGPPETLVWKYPFHELGTWTQLIVNESQEAILFKGGQAADLFGPGRHTLSTQNIPVLSSLVNVPFGGDSPFTAEVWYINKLRSLDLKWGTATPIQLQEPKYRMFVSVRAHGQFGIQVEDSRKFLVRLIGTQPSFDTASLGRYFRGILMMNIKELISSYLIHKQISILDINAYISEISEHIGQRIESSFLDNGIRLLNFNIESINLPDDDPATTRLKEALAKKAEMDILGFTYQQERTFDTLESAAKNEGSAATVMGAGLGLGMGYGLGGAMGGTMGSLTDQLRTGGGQQQSCPTCQTVVSRDAKFCSGCGQSLQRPNPATVVCGQCGNASPAGSKFCAHCGSGLVRRCGQCQQEVQPGQRFCFQCGHGLA